MFDLRNGSTPFLSSSMQRYKDNPRRLRADAAKVRRMMGFSCASAFYDGVEVKETFEKDFRQIPHCEPLTPVALILVLDLYFRLTPITMVASTPEVEELARLIGVKARVVKTTETGQAACPCGATCLPIMGNVLAPVGHIFCQTDAQ